MIIQMTIVIMYYSFPRVSIQNRIIKWIKEETERLNASLGSLPLFQLKQIAAAGDSYWSQTWDHIISFLNIFIIGEHFGFGNYEKKRASPF